MKLIKLIAVYLLATVAAVLILSEPTAEDGAVWFWTLLWSKGLGALAAVAAWKIFAHLNRA